MKKLKLSVLFGLIIGLCILSAACSGNTKLDFMTNGKVFKTYQITGKSPLLPPEDPEIDGYTFEGWFWDNGVWDDLYAPNSVMNKKLSKNMQVHAKLVLIDYNITYHLDSGINSSDNPSTYNIETLLTLNIPSKFNHDFAGWYTESTFVNRVTQISKGSMGNFDLYAKWIVKSEGSEDEPYEIGTASELIAFAIQVNSGISFKDLHLALTADIDLDGEEWLPIGRDDRYFEGTFDGGNHVISNLKITSTSNGYVGLFGSIRTAEIKNLTLENISINVTYGDMLWAGGVAGHNVRSSITNCSSGGSIVATSPVTVYAGGLIGHNDYLCHITDSDSSVNVSASTTGKSHAYAGGLVGYHYFDSTIENCFATGEITAYTGGDHLVFIAFAGGLVGSNATATITKSYATGNVSSTSSRGSELPSSAFAGGLAGNNEGEITICYATGTVTAKFSPYVGGFVGQNFGLLENCYATGDVFADTTSASPAPVFAGGLIGSNTSGTARFCYATGNIDAKAQSQPVCAGGVTGDNLSGDIISCFATGNITATVTTAGVEAYIGGVIGFYENPISSSTCYRYSGQIITKAVGTSSSSTPSNTAGEGCTVSQINSPSFYTGNLTWSGDIWNFADLDFAGGIMPTLKAFDENN